MATTILTKPRPKKERRAPRQPLRRRLRHIEELPGNIHLFACYSMTRTGKEEKHTQEIDLHTLEARCSCGDYTYRHAKHLPRITKDEHLCKHLKRCVDWLIRNDKWEPVAVAEQRCSHCGAKGAEHEMCDDAGNPLPERICGDCLETVRRMLDPTPDPVPDWVPDVVPDYEPEIPLWDGGEEAYP